MSGNTCAQENPVAVAGRVCPLDYALGPDTFNQSVAQADVLYVAGGLYGNPFALTAIEELVAAESGTGDRVLLALNGDFHWFDTGADWFADIHSRTVRHLLTRGNIETELSRGGDTEAGCGCAYPDSVSDVDVGRSNSIMRDLGKTAREQLSPIQLQEIGRLPAALAVDVGLSRIGITHGDDFSLAGWSFAHDQLQQTWARGLAERMQARGVDIFASSHTCLPVADSIDTGNKTVAIINNGSAGMANFSGSRFGLVSRFAHRDAANAPVPALYEACIGDVIVSAIPVHFAIAPWLALFESHWPDNSAASQSYRDRIVNGPAYSIEQAARGRFRASRIGASTKPMVRLPEATNE